MKWIQAGSFLVQPTQQNVPVIELSAKLNKPDHATLVYNPNLEHALLFRGNDEGIILDYLTPNTISLLDSAPEVAICELDTDTQQVKHYYRAPVFRVRDEFKVQLFKRKAA